MIGRVTPPPTPTLRAGASARLSVALDGTPGPAQVGLFLARERGYYLDAGLEVFFHVVPSRAAALAAVGQGRDELGIAGGDDVLRARAAGTPVVSLLALDPRGPDGYDLVLVATDDGRARNGPALQAFARATARGYAEAGRDPRAANETLGRAASELDRPAAARHIEQLLPFWSAPGPPLAQDEGRWARAQERLAAQGQVPPSLDLRAVFSNDLSLAAAPTPTVVPSPTARPAAPTARATGAAAVPTAPAVAPAPPRPAAPAPAAPATPTPAPAVPTQPTPTAAPPAAPVAVPQPAPSTAANPPPVPPAAPTTAAAP